MGDIGVREEVRGKKGTHSKTGGLFTYGECSKALSVWLHSFESVNPGIAATARFEPRVREFGDAFGTQHEILSARSFLFLLTGSSESPYKGNRFP